MKQANRRQQKRNAVFETVRLLEKAHIHFDIQRNRPDALTFLATIVGERIEIDVFADDHIEISRFRGDESIEGGMELLVEIANAQLKENYPDEVTQPAAK